MQPVSRAQADSSDTADYVPLEELVGRFYESEPLVTVSAEFAARTHPGNVREVNEDQFLVTRRRRVREVIAASVPHELLHQPEQSAYAAAIADGMGGMKFGELASLLALKTGWELGGGEIKWVHKVNERESAELSDKARVFYRLIHEALQAAAEAHPRLTPMGTTLTIAYVTGPELFVLHAGDSRAYLHRNGALRRLTRDHNLAQDLIDAGLAEPGSEEERRRRHILTNCLGGPKLDVDVEVTHHRLRHGDRILLCTDGLTTDIDDPEIAAVLEQHDDLDVACRALVDLALERGGSDNITVVLGRFTFADEENPDEPAHDAPGSARGAR